MAIVLACVTEIPYCCQPATVGYLCKEKCFFLLYAEPLARLNFWHVGAIVAAVFWKRELLLHSRTSKSFEHFLRVLISVYLCGGLGVSTGRTALFEIVKKKRCVGGGVREYIVRQTPVLAVSSRGHKSNANVCAGRSHQKMRV